MNTPLATATVATWDEAKAYLDEHTSANAYTLAELTAEHDAELHEVILDPDTRTIWWAYDNSPLDAEGWTIDQLTPADAAKAAENIADIVQDRLGDPTSYCAPNTNPDRDQVVMDEYAEILRLGLPADPVDARAQIRHRRHLISREDALWQRTDAELVRALAGPRHGGKIDAARILGITDVQVGRIIRNDDKRRDELTEAVRAARDADAL